MSFIFNLIISCEECMHRTDFEKSSPTRKFFYSHSRRAPVSHAYVYILFVVGDYAKEGKIVPKPNYNREKTKRCKKTSCIFFPLHLHASEIEAKLKMFTLSFTDTHFFFCRRYLFLIKNKGKFPLFFFSNHIAYANFNAPILSAQETRERALKANMINSESKKIWYVAYFSEGKLKKNISEMRIWKEVFWNLKLILVFK